MNKKQNVDVGRVLSFYLSTAKKKYRLGVTLLLIRTFTSLVPLVTPLYYKNIIDLLASSTGNDLSIYVSPLLGMILIIFALEILAQFAWRLFEQVIIKFELGGMQELYQLSFDAVHSHSYRFFTNTFGGSLVKKVNKLVRGYEKIVDMFIFTFYPLVVMLIVIIVMVSLQSMILGGIFLGWVVLFVAIQFPFFKWKLPYELLSHAQDSKNTGHLADTITNHDAISVFGTKDREAESFKKQIVSWRKAVAKSRTLNNLIYAVNGFSVVIFNAGVLVVSVHLRAKGVISVGTFVLLQLYLNRIVDHIFDIANVFKRAYNAIGEAAEMIDIIDDEIEIKDMTGATGLVVDRGSICFDNVGFSYISSRKIFNNLSIDIAAGEKIALVGESGAGKSTIIKLILRYFDIQSGSISIDGISISSVLQDSLRSNISFVPQEPILFHRTLRENIAYGNPNATLEQIEAAATMARCHKFISQLPEGYETIVGERGVKLSGGERQRVAIARAILEDKKILILDEATSSLDSESEKLIKEAIHELIQDKTAIVVAHRLSTIKEMDRILVFDQGEVIEQGSHKNLLNITNGTYKKLRTIQAT